MFPTRNLYRKLLLTDRLLVCSAIIPYVKNVTSARLQLCHLPKSVEVGRSGRHRESGVWQFYTFDNGTHKSKCTACGRLIAGKNPTNLKSHLKANHKDRLTELEEIEAQVNRKRDKMKKIRKRLDCHLPWVRVAI
jgi:hypothetical protein